MTAIDTEPTAAVGKTRDEIMAATVAALTEAARLTSRNGAGGTEQADWAEFVTQALAGAAANIGGIEKVLAGRPGSWEADYVRNLLSSTVGHDEEYLLEHRTEPVVVNLFVDEILADLGVWSAYDAAESELGRRYEALHIPTQTTPQSVVLTPATEEQERHLDDLAELEQRLEQQRLTDWAAYGDALKAGVEAAAAGLSGLRVPVVVNINLHTWPAHDLSDHAWGWEDVAGQLRAAAIETAPLPAPEPLRRAEGADGTSKTSGHPA